VKLRSSVGNACVRINRSKVPSGIITLIQE
jgi:hypothetical protein